MATLALTRMVLFKHGVGYFERRGTHSGEQLELSFPREAMDDVLKSLVALDLGAGQVLGVDFETPEDRAARLARGSIHLGDQLSLLDLLRDLRGRAVRLTLAEGKKAEASLEGLMVGVDYESAEPLRRATVSLYSAATRQVRTVAVEALARVELLDDGAAADLAYFLRAAQSEEQRRAASLRLSPGDHDLLIGYIAPAPAWRVSYRLLYEEAATTPADDQRSAVSGQQSTVLLQGWGLFDNQLEEDLTAVQLTLMAGKPVSFRYRLYEPHTPERPLVQDEERTVDAPIFFEAAPPAPPMVAAFSLDRLEERSMGLSAPTLRSPAPRLSVAALEDSVQAAASGDERGALFAYKIAHPVSVARGQSAMVPIVSQRLPARRELLYNGAKHPRHPVVSLRLTNGTGLTLERGPVTVLADGDYAGEAVLPFTKTGGELLVPFAIELGLKVEEERRGERRLIGMSFENEFAIFEEHDLVLTTYHLISGLDHPVEVTVEHIRLISYEVAAPRAPDEESAGFARWCVACAPQAHTILQITERQLTHRSEQVRGLNGTRLQAFLRDKILDAATVKALEAILDLYRQAAQVQAQITTLMQEREVIFKQQRQIQGNLQPLAREGEEGALRQRYVTTLGQLEDRLAALEAEEKRLREQIVELEDQATKRLKRLAKA